MTPKRIQNPKRLTPAEKAKAKVNEYEEFPAEIQQKIPQRIEFLNPNHTNSIIMEEVLQTSAKFLGDNPTNYPIHIQILLDNLTRAFIKRHINLHEKSMKVLEYHLICNEILLQSIASPNDQPAAKIINWARSPTEIYQIQIISPKEMGKVRRKVLDLPSEIQNLIFHNPSYTEYFDRWIQRMMLITNGEDKEYKEVYSKKTLRVFEPHCCFPGLIYIPEKDYRISKQHMNKGWELYEIGNTELGAQLFEEGFLSYYPVKHIKEVRDFPPIVRNTVKNIQNNLQKRHLGMSVNQSTVLRIWSTVPKFDPENYMEVKSAEHCILINPFDSDLVAELRMGRIPLKLDDPLGIINLWRTFKKKFMINAVQELSPIRKVLANNDRIIIFGEDISALGIWEQLLRQSKYIYQNEKWWSQTDINPKEIIDESIALDSDGT
jgi:hypothetical protein